ncbi:hypothetical protein DBR06_SOUSAS13210047 [Sousa chinensis]|nr:hypothetical protein DBR06_SOUSAS13210047 [Sousa chinensis]
MNWTAAACWALLLAATFLCDSGAAKGGPAAGAAAGAAAGLAAGSSWRRAAGPGEHGPDDDEDGAPGGNGTNRSVYSYRAWTSGAGPMGDPHLCLLLGGALGALGLLRT